MQLRTRHRDKIEYRTEILQSIYKEKQWSQTPENPKAGSPGIFVHCREKYMYSTIRARIVVCKEKFKLDYTLVISDKKRHFPYSLLTSIYFRSKLITDK